MRVPRGGKDDKTGSENETELSEVVNKKKLWKLEFVYEIHMSLLVAGLWDS